MTDPRNTGEWKRIRKIMLERYPECAICGSTDNLQVDHIIPISNNGAPFDEQNLRVLCGFHNNSKGSKTTEQATDWINPVWLKWSAGRQAA